MKTLKDLKAGDKVVRFSHWMDTRTVHTIEKITPSGMLKVDGDLYYLTGRMRGTGPYIIEVATPEIEQQIADNTLISRTLGYMREVETLTIDQARKIAAILTEGA